MLQNTTVMAVIPAHNLARAKVFYEKMLGLVPAEGATRAGEAIYLLGDGRLMVYETKAELGGATKVAITVKDLDRVMSDLRNHGIIFEELDFPGIKTTNGVVEDEFGKGAWFKDTEGNWIGLAQPKV